MYPAGVVPSHSSMFETFSMFPISKLGGGYLDRHDKMARLDEQEAARKDGMREKVVAFIGNRLSATDKTFQGDESEIWAKRVNGDEKTENTPPENKKVPPR